jgi:hypothetical protein
MRQYSLALLGLVGLSIIGGCSDSDGSADLGTGLRSVVIGTGVSGFHYDVTQVSCDDGSAIDGGVAGSADADLRVGQTLPGNLSTFIDKPFAQGSTHNFADKFFTLPAGCYDVLVKPIGEGAETCSMAQAKKVQVNEGLTTEILLISQCAGVDPGALDAIAALNHDPSIDAVYFPESKFTCAEPAEICVVASDVDHDPLRKQITFAQGTPCSIGEWSPSADPRGGECTAITCTEPGSFVPQVAVYDQAYNGLNELVDIETLLVDFGGGVGLTSHANLDAQIHIDGVVLYRDGDGDQFGSEAKLFCTAPQEGYVAVAGDCDDADGNRFPGNTEVCDYDHHDENCDDIGALEPAVAGFDDSDEDGYGGGDVRYYCTEEDRDESGDFAQSTDCDDSQASVHPGAEEICGDGIDQDCSGEDEVCPVVEICGDGIDQDGVDGDLPCTHVYWATGWQSVDDYDSVPSVQGTIDLPYGPDVTVTFRGSYKSLQTGAPGETNYWASIDGAYTSETVENGVDTTALIQLQRSGNRSFTFSVPVDDPVIAVVSLGNEDKKTTYDFKSNFNILSSGTNYWGLKGSFEDKAGDKLEGKQGNGVIEFTSNSTTSKIEWSISNGDEGSFGQGINVGLRR